MSEQLVRVEHSDGYGMFRRNLDDENRTKRPHSVLYNPKYPDLQVRHKAFNCPYEDRLDLTEDKFCAFQSVEQIQKWITPQEFQTLIEDGYDIYLLEVSECERGRDNALYKKEHILHKTNISNLFIC